jgi:hypothetical protein
MRAVLSLAVAVATLTYASAGAGQAPTRQDAETSRTIAFGPGRAHRVLTMRQPRGVVLLTRLTTTYGIRASVAATIPGVGGVRAVNYGNLGSPSPCRREGSLMVCTPSHEWCPMPKARWRVHVLKAGGPAGIVRFDFVVGPPPRR